MITGKQIGVATSLLTLAGILVTAGWTSVVWALDNTYVRQEALTHELDTREFHRREDALTDKVLQYSIKGSVGELTEADKALKEVYIQQLERLRKNRDDQLKAHAIKH